VTAARGITPVVSLRPTTLADLPLIMTWVNDLSVMQSFAGHQKCFTEDEEEKYLSKLLLSPTDKVYSIFENEDYVGQCSISQISWSARNGRLFVVVCKNAQGRGCGTEAIKALLKNAWEELNLHKVWLIVRKNNVHSQVMYLKLGFEFEGVLRDEYCVNGKYYDMVRMGIVRPNAVYLQDDPRRMPVV